MSKRTFSTNQKCYLFYKKQGPQLTTVQNDSIILKNKFFWTNMAKSHFYRLQGPTQWSFSSKFCCFIFEGLEEKIVLQICFVSGEISNITPQ